MKVIMSTPDITFGVLDGTQASAHAEQLQALHAEVRACAARPGRLGAARFPDRFRVQRRQPGYVLAEARHGGYLVGYASGFPLRPSTSWWRNVTTALPGEVTAEHPGPHVRADRSCRGWAPWRRQGIGSALHDLVLRDRPEERATLTVPPAAVPAQAAFRAWGWRKVARTRDAGTGSSVSDVLVLTLPVAGMKRQARGGMEDKPVAGWKTSPWRGEGTSLEATAGPPGTGFPVPGGPARAVSPKFPLMSL